MQSVKLRQIVLFCCVLLYVLVLIHNAITYKQKKTYKQNKKKTKKTTKYVCVCVCVCVFKVESMIPEMSDNLSKIAEIMEIATNQGIDAQNKLRNIEKHQAIQVNIETYILYFCLFVSCDTKHFGKSQKNNKHKQLRNENLGSFLMVEMERIKEKCKKMDEMCLLMNKIINDKSKIDISKYK